MDPLAAVPEAMRREVEGFPAPLRALLAAELAAGNAIAELGHGHPAAPVGAWLRMERRIATPAPQGVDYARRNSATCGGEYGDAQRHFFLLDPPWPDAGAYPDMDAIRAAMQPPPTALDRIAMREARDPAATLRQALAIPVDYEQWREGTSHALDALRAASPAEREAVADDILARTPRDWRDVEALALLGGPRAEAALRRVFEGGDVALQAAVRRAAPHLVTEAERLDSLLRALREGEFYGGLTQALDAVPACHPPPVIEALLRGCLARDGGIAVHFAAMLLFLHGGAAEPFDWAHRPFFLRFNTEDRAERRAVFRELCARCGIDAAPYLRRRR